MEIKDKCNVPAGGPACVRCFLSLCCLSWEISLHNIFTLYCLGSPDSKSDLSSGSVWCCKLGVGGPYAICRDLWCALWPSVFIKRDIALRDYGYQQAVLHFDLIRTCSNLDVHGMLGRASYMSHTSVFKIKVAGDCSNQGKVGAALVTGWINFFIFYIFLCPSV